MARMDQLSEMPNFSETLAGVCPNHHSWPMLRRTWLPVLPVLVVLGTTFTPAANAQPDVSTRTVGATTTFEYTTAQFENRLLSRTNARRARVGCAPVKLNSSLIRSSRAHSAAMARVQQLSHQ